MPVLEKCKLGAVAVYNFFDDLFWVFLNKDARMQNKYFKAQQILRSQYMMEAWNVHTQDFARDEEGRYDSAAILLSQTNRTRIHLEKALALADLTVGYQAYCVSAGDHVGEQTAHGRLKDEIQELKRRINEARKEHVSIEPYCERYPWAKIHLTS